MNKSFGAISLCRYLKSISEQIFCLNKSVNLFIVVRLINGYLLRLLAWTGLLQYWNSYLFRLWSLSSLQTMRWSRLYESDVVRYNQPSATNKLIVETILWFNIIVRTVPTVLPRIIFLNQANTVGLVFK